MMNDVIVEGSGLRACLLAFCLQRMRPDWRVRLVSEDAYLPDGEPEPIALDDVPASLVEIVDPLLVGVWSDYRVLFEGFSRRLDGRVALLAPEQLSIELLQALPPENIRMGGPAARARPVPAGAPVLRFPDETGREAPASLMVTQSYRFDEPHDLAAPILVDASKDWPGIDFLQYFPLSPECLQIRYVGLGDRAEPPRQLPDPQAWPRARLLRQSTRRLSWTGSAPCMAGDGAVRLPKLGARQGHPAFASAATQILWTAGALAQARGARADDMLAALDAAHARSAPALLHWERVNDVLVQAPPESKRAALASLYKRDA